MMEIAVYGMMSEVLTCRQRYLAAGDLETDNCVACGWFAQDMKAR
jgi:hypothetical protein